MPAQSHDSLRSSSRLLLGSLAVVAGAAVLATGALAQTRARSGAAVVATYCASCHDKGDNGAPRIGDAKAWAPRASQGLSALTAHALQGIRNMPAHGGSPGLNDIEIERAITHMVNRSGGHWVEPLGGASPAVVRTGEQVAMAQCANCHVDGQNGAPRMGDRQAWLPRLSKGLDAVVRAAIHGHGGMPARGGLPDLSDAEIHGAVVYMFNRGLTPAVAAAPAAAPADPYHQVVDGQDIYFDIVRTTALPASRMKGVPKGSNQYRLSVTLYDTKSRAPITDARVQLRVSDGATTESRALQAFGADGALGYGGYFRMPGPNPYTVTARIQRPGSAAATEATFEYKVW